MLSLFQLIAILLTLTSAFAWFNHRLLRLPANIGLLVMGLAASLLLVGLEFLFPDTAIHGELTRIIAQIDFYEAVMNGMLAFLLFAGALHVDLDRLRSRAWVVGSLATIGVLISMFIVGSGLWALAQLLNMPLSYAWALVFGALIAPTDPVAVLSTLRAVEVPQSLEMDMTGEALFNDGVGVVFFLITLELATHPGDFGLVHVGQLLMTEALGGALLGLATGWIAYRALRSIDDYPIEVMITLALVMGTYALAEPLHVSGPIAVVVAGVLIGNQGAACAMSETTRRYVFGFWTLIDDTLNALLFLLIGLEVLVLHFSPDLLWIGLLTIPIVVFARLASVGIPVFMLSHWYPFSRGTIAVLTWGGVHGGISIALALSLPSSSARMLILAATYAVVLFSIIIQGLSLDRVVRRTALADRGTDASLTQMRGQKIS